MIYSDTSGDCAYCYKRATLFCVHDKLSFCINCIEAHTNSTVSYSHKIIDKSLLPELEENAKRDKETLKSAVRKSLISKLVDERSSIQSTTDSIVSTLNSKAESLMNKIQSSCTISVEKFKDRSLEITHKINALISSVENGESDLLDSLDSIESVESIIFVEKAIAIVDDDFYDGIINAFHCDLKFYPSGKPKNMYRFLPGRSHMLCCDVKTAEVTKSSLDFVCKEYAGICFNSSGGLLYSGGWDNRAFNECYYINTLVHQVLQIADMNIGRFQHCCIYLDPYFYVFGGLTTDSNMKNAPTLTCEKWCEQKWTELNEKLSDQLLKGSACLYQNKIYICANDRLEVFDPRKETFIPINLKWENKFAGIIVNFSNRLLVFRGDKVYQVEDDNCFVITNVSKVEWRSSSPILINGENVYCYLDTIRQYCCFNCKTYQTKYFTIKEN